MKKLFAFISVFLMLSVSIFADVSVKKLDNGKYEVTFFYGNPRAAEVVIAGDFTNWQNGAEPMTKTDKGWTYTKVVPAGTTMKYKFISDGNWTADIKAPDTIDDGFGGLNGLVDVDALGGSNGAAAAGPKIKFQTWSMTEIQASGNAKTMEMTDVGLGVVSYLKFSGEVLPKLPVYFEIAAFEQNREGDTTKGNIYSKGTLDAATGLYNLGMDLLFDPLYWLGGQKSKTPDNAVAATGWGYLGHFKVGLSSDYVNWTAAAKYAKLPPHSINGWVTVDKEWEAGYTAVGGYSAFELGSKLQQLPFGTLTASVIPNRSADRAGSQYGLIAWANLNLGQPAVIDFQYNGAFGTTFDHIFDTIMEEDFIVGYKGQFGDIGVKANYLVSLFGSTKVDDNYKSYYTPSTSDVGTVNDNPDNYIDNMAANVSATYANDDLSATLGFRMRGAQANMMYVEEGSDDHWNISDQLGSLNRMRIYGDVNGNVTTALNIGIAPYAETTLNKDSKLSFSSAETWKIYAKPYFALDLDELAYIPAKLEGYAEVKAITNEADAFTSVLGTGSYFDLPTVGIKYTHTFSNDIVKGFDATYVFDNTNSEQLFNYVYGTVEFAKDYKVQLGCGLRTANNGGAEPTNPFGFFVGATKKLPVLYKPTAYVQFLYAMCPYNKKLADGPTAFKLDDYKFYNHDDEAVKTFADSYALRLGLQWDL